MQCINHLILYPFRQPRTPLYANNLSSRNSISNKVLKTILQTSSSLLLFLLASAFLLLSYDSRKWETTKKHDFVSLLNDYKFAFTTQSMTFSKAMTWWLHLPPPQVCKILHKVWEYYTKSQPFLMKGSWTSQKELLLALLNQHTTKLLPLSIETFPVQPNRLIQTFHPGSSGKSGNSSVFKSTPPKVLLIELNSCFPMISN